MPARLACCSSMVLPDTYWHGGTWLRRVATGRGQGRRPPRLPARVPGMAPPLAILWGGQGDHTCQRGCAHLSTLRQCAYQTAWASPTPDSCAAPASWCKICRHSGAMCPVWSRRPTRWSTKMFSSCCPDVLDCRVISVAARYEQRCHVMSNLVHVSTSLEYPHNHRHHKGAEAPSMWPPAG